jgi:hypothetical protein
MKNNNDHQIKQARDHRQRKAVMLAPAHTDILVIPQVAQENMRRIAAQPPRRRRRVDYAKKIMNDPFIFNA